MTRIRFIKTVALVVAAAAIVGCKAKQEAPSAQSQPQKTEAVKSISGQAATGAVASSPKDKADAEAAANRVLAQMESGAFPAIYQEAAPGFKAIGKEADFAAKFEKTRQLIGPLKQPQETSFVSLPDRSHVLVYHMENDKYKTERRLTFVRNKEGKMELFGLNQHDEPKNPAAK